MRLMPQKLLDLPLLFPVAFLELLQKVEQLIDVVVFV
jgi:hypothetical protein